LKNPEGVIRSYSLASLPAKDHFLELHIRRKKSGQFSHWIFDEFQLGEYIDLQAPPLETAFIPHKITINL
jgi:NAD(P)H-flavin reductase